MIHPVGIEVVTGVHDLGPMERPNSHDAAFARDSTGRLWVRKRQAAFTKHGLLAEIVGWLVGAALGVDQPTAAVAQDSEREWSWLSQWLNTTEHWGEHMAGSIANPGAVGTMLAVDALVANGDRHPGNILADVDDYDASLYRLWAIDWDAAVVGYIGEFEQLGCDCRPPVANHARCLPLVTLRDHALAAADRAVNLPAEQLDWIAEDGRRVLAESELFRSRLSGALQRRCTAAPNIVSRYLELIGDLG